MAAGAGVGCRNPSVDLECRRQGSASPELGAPPAGACLRPQDADRDAFDFAGGAGHRVMPRRRQVADYI